jgi:hypothetical protein
MSKNRHVDSMLNSPTEVDVYEEEIIG